MAAPSSSSWRGSLLRGLACLAVLLTALWGGTALVYQGPDLPAGRVALIALWGGFSLAALVLLLRRRAAAGLGLYALGFAALLAWWSGLAPSNTRDWADDVAHTATATVQGSVVSFDHVRNFDWRSDTDYNARWEARQYDLDQLQSVDLVLSYWAGPAIAHTLVSFGFSDGRFLVFSVEIRKERHESFSEVGGFFKEFELAVIAADERDILRVRTNVRGEDDYLYRIALPPAQRRALFLAYVDEANRLAQAPRFYQTVTANCTTIVYKLVQQIVPQLPLDYRLVLSGYLPEYLQEVGGLAGQQPLAALQQGGRFTERAKAADASPAFSQAIRRGVPGIETKE
jgi:hypothetical protein